MATHCSILAWRIQWTDEPGRLQSIRLQELDMTKGLSLHNQSLMIYTPIRSMMLQDFMLLLTWFYHKSGRFGGVLKFHTYRFSWGLLFCLCHFWLCHPMDCSMPGFPILLCLLEFALIHVHRVNDAIQQSHPLSSPSAPAFNLSLNQGLFQWIVSSH